MSGVRPRVGGAGLGLIAIHPYSAPYSGSAARSTLLFPCRCIPPLFPRRDECCAAIITSYPRQLWGQEFACRRRRLHGRSTSESRPNRCSAANGECVPTHEIAARWVGALLEERPSLPPSNVTTSHASSDYLAASAPAFATCPSCCAVAPETPIAPTIFPSTIMGSPPSNGAAPRSASVRSPIPP